MYLKKHGFALYAHLAWLIPAAILLRLGVAFYDIGISETVFSNISLSINSAANLFGIYVQNGDFIFKNAPIIPLLSSIFGGAVANASDVNMQMYLVKIIPCILDTMLIAVLFKMQVEVNAKNLLLVPIFWAINPSAIFNCAILGQYDSAFLLIIALLFYATLRKNTYFVCIAFAVGCLVKAQMLYLIPVLVLYLIFDCQDTPIVKRVVALFSGFAIVFLGWLPFMSLGGGLLLPIKIYFPSFNVVADKTHIIANIFALFAPNTRGIDTAAVDKSQFRQISDIIMILLMLILGACILYGLSKRVCLPTCVVALAFINSVYMFTINGDATFQLISMLLAIMCYISTQRTGYFALATGLSLVTVLSQWASALNSMQTKSIINPNLLMQILSCVNILLYVFMVLLLISETVKSIKRSKIMF